MTIRKKFLLLYIALLVILQEIEAIPTWYTASDGNSYLIEAEEKYNWLQAYNLCARQDLQLVVIDDAAKNAAFDKLLRSIFVKTLNIWLGYHDEFNKKERHNRPFYTVSTGQKATYTNWAPNEPNNSGEKEHCVHIFINNNFQWNDKECTSIYGYVCEKNHLTLRYEKDLHQKRFETNKKNSNISLVFKNTDNEIQRNIKSGHKITNNILLNFDNDLDEIIDESKSSINEILNSKPYLIAVIADVGDMFRKLFHDTQKEILQASKEARESIENVQSDTENRVKDELTIFENSLSTNANEIDNILEK